jgi:sec-independent protein translocase protein TatB
MFGIGWGEIALILVVAVLVVPPEDLPKLMREAGKWFGKIKRMTDSARKEFEDALKVDEPKK